MKQNVTIAIEKDLVKKARIIAARRETSLSRMLTEELNRLVGDDERYVSAKRKALAQLRQGLSLGGSIAATREQWHER